MPDALPGYLTYHLRATFLDWELRRADCVPRCDTTGRWAWIAGHFRTPPLPDHRLTTVRSSAVIVDRRCPSGDGVPPQNIVWFNT